jgi:hypothetical protein
LIGGICANHFITFSTHAREEAARRNIPLEVLHQVMETPDQVVAVHSQRQAYQSKVVMDAKLYVVRVIVEMTDPPTVITIYRTSKIEKYWSVEP